MSAEESGAGAGVGSGGDGDAHASALHENISTKGRNAYYYAHAHTIDPGMKGKLVGDHAPEPLGKVAGMATPTERTSPITRYSWSDGKKSVKVYITFEALNLPTAPAADAVTVDFSETSVSLKVSTDAASHVLLLPKLHDAITSATTKMSDTKITLTLKKATEFTWHELVEKKK